MIGVWRGSSPKTGDDVSRCPWLRKVRGKDQYVCRIQDVKPDLCRDYPLSREHAEETGCPGFVQELRCGRADFNEE